MMLSAPSLLAPCCVPSRGHKRPIIAVTRSLPVTVIKSPSLLSFVRDYTGLFPHKPAVRESTIRYHLRRTGYWFNSHISVREDRLGGSLDVFKDARELHSDITREWRGHACAIFFWDDPLPYHPICVASIKEACDETGIPRTQVDGAIKRKRFTLARDSSAVVCTIEYLETLIHDLNTARWRISGFPRDDRPFQFRDLVKDTVLCKIIPTHLARLLQYERVETPCGVFYRV